MSPGTGLAHTPSPPHAPRLPPADTSFHHQIMQNRHLLHAVIITTVLPSAQRNSDESHADVVRGIDTKQYTFSTINTKSPAINPPSPGPK
ncbi:unnamed protein product [Colias eurytheme]|nr:unnamed protein product [Colias eurytheme]